MSVSTLCEVCESRTADYSCSHCGQMVCERHFDTDSGYCVDCESRFGGGSDQPQQGEDLPDGVDTYEF
jgi:ribosomal protein L37AE/L43A